MKFLSEIYSKEQIFENEPMKNHTSFKIGGNADVLVTPKDEFQIEQTINICKENNYKYFIMGNGSNLLVSDKGINGLVIKIGRSYSRYNLEDDEIYFESGILLSTLSKIAMENSLSGIEFASGIPGTLGGAVIMNAGAYGGEMKDVIQRVKFIDENGKISNYTNEQMEFKYRRSILSDSNSVVLGAYIKLEKGDRDSIKSVMDDLAEKRNSKQPINMPSAGSTFKRPSGNFAGKLIDDSGLRGLRHGDAMVSQKHCGFIINTGNATAKDVKELIGVVQKTVFDNYKIKLETEVKMVGED